MISFKEFYLEHIMIKGVKTNPHYRGDARANALNRGNVVIDGKVGGSNIIGSRYENPKDPNFDKNRVQKTGLISNDEAEEYIITHNIKSFPARLGKRPFMLSKTPNGFVIQKIKD